MTPLLGAFFERYLVNISASRCPMAMKNERAAVRDFEVFIRTPRLAKIDAERVDAWRIYLLGRYKPNTARLKLCILKKAFSYALALRFVRTNPFETIVLPKITFGGKIIPDKTLRVFLAGCPPLIRRMMKFALYTGMRKKEFGLLDWSEVHRDRIILAPERTKNRKGRTVYLNAAARRCLGTRGVGKVFKISIPHLNKMVTRIWRRLGIGRIRIHDLRHTAATRHYDKNHDDYAMIDTFGWCSTESAKPYHHVTDERVKKSMTRLTYAI